MALSSISERAVCRHLDLTLALRCGEGWRWFICSASVDQYRLAGCPDRQRSPSLSRHTRTGIDGGHHKPEGMSANAGGVVFGSSLPAVVGILPLRSLSGACYNLLDKLLPRDTGGA